ncbi:hypothetical protein GCM10008992_13950 [Halorubrum aquaticum]
MSEHVGADIDTDDFSRIAEISEVPAGATGNVEDTAVRIRELVAAISTGE